MQSQVHSKGNLPVVKPLKLYILPYRHLIFGVLFIFSGSVNILYGQEKKISIRDQQWLQYYNQAKLNKKWLWTSDVGYRWKNAFKENSQYIARTGIGYSINQKMRTSIGFAHTGSFSKNRINKVEFRPYQDFEIKHKLKNTGFNHRLRIEERFFNPVLNGEIQTPNTFNFRIRYSFMASIPLFKLSKDKPESAFLLNLGNEVFINAGKGIGNNFFDQNRIILSPSFKFNEKLTLSLTWNSQFSKNTNSSNYTYTNVFWLQIRHFVDFRKKVND